MRHFRSNTSISLYFCKKYGSYNAFAKRDRFCGDEIIKHRFFSLVFFSVLAVFYHSFPGFFVSWLHSPVSKVLFINNKKGAKNLALP
jgi:hypothetical protein